MRTYRLPDALGGREVEVLTGFARPDARVDVRVPGVVGVVTLESASVLVVVLPPEPGLGAVVLVAGEAVQHFEGGHDDDTSYWVGAGCAQRYTWAEVVRLAEPNRPVLLVPAPPVVALPWTGHPEKAGAGVGACWANLLVQSNNLRGHVTVTTGATFAYASPATAREMAYALLTAADEAERVSDGN